MRILFVCEGNVNRSQAAAAFLEPLMPEAHIESAGTLVEAEREGRPVSTITPSSVEAMRERGFYIGDAEMHRLTEEMVSLADVVVLVGPTKGGPLPEFLSARADVREWGVPDPGYGDIGFPEACDLIRPKVEALAVELKTQ